MVAPQEGLRIMLSRSRIWRFWLALAISLPACGLASAGDWPRFRGPNGAGIADDKGVPVTWTEDNILWKTAIPGAGHSSPIVCKGRVFLQSASEDGDERWLLCLDARKGEILWKTRSPGEAAKKHPLNSLASSTPATDGERVYAAFWDGTTIHLGAYDFKDGKLLWQHDLGSYKSQHGFGHSPMLIGGKVILANDQDGTSHLLAFEAESGNKVWQTERKPYRACYSTPILRDKPEGGKELVVVSTTEITGYNPADGKANWWYTWKFAKKPLRTVGSPITAGESVLASSGDGDGSRHLIAVRFGGQGEVSRKNLLWEKTARRYSPYVPSLLTRGNYLYSINDDGLAVCQLAQSGEEIWRKELKRKSFLASPILVDGKVYAIDVDGSVFVFAAEPKFQLLATNTLGEAVTSSPAVADNRLFIRGENHLFCIGKPAAASR